MNDKPMFCGSKSAKEKQKQCLAFFRILKHHCFACSKLKKINLVLLQNPKTKCVFKLQKMMLFHGFRCCLIQKILCFFNDICFALAAYEKKLKNIFPNHPKIVVFGFPNPGKWTFHVFFFIIEKKNIFFEFAAGPLKKKKVFSNLKESRVFAGFPSWDKVPMCSGYH